MQATARQNGAQINGTLFDPSGIYLQTTTPVGSYAPNGWGLYDMIGNVEEWCQDCYGPYPAGPVTDPQGATSDTFGRVLRGGAWNTFAVGCRSAVRIYNGHSSIAAFFAFRVVLAPNP